MKKQVLIVSLINGLLGISQSNCLHENKRGTYTKHKHRTQKKKKINTHHHHQEAPTENHQCKFILKNYHTVNLFKHNSKFILFQRMNN